MGEIINLNKKVNWVKWLEDRKLAMMPTPFDLYMEECVKAASEVADKYGMRSVEVIITDTSIHFNFIKDSTLYLNIVPRSLIIKTCRITPHIEKAVRLQLIRQIKRDKKKQQQNQNPA